MQDPLVTVIVVAHIAATASLFLGVFTCFAQMKVASTAIEAIARQPEAGGTIQRSMIIGLAMSETAGIYGFLIAILMLFANPLVATFIQHM